ncbi:D-glycero-alpha-D-manno-heptose-1,7-bisphosphate 7-phosphatase [Roseivirga misakiensis]|uniref:D,D-heptose 1,7-bisphosphate phosphatase n=1 Tax=Roseivirga misakiensis TaxID=1563681 RepID=A0A1E5T2E7_9BACT|nr:HAD-IIIA family hydrolase [Roseivirga misakiensis]OEK05516.1 D,D-heptose 1,7-bisphosphate phosphatase [Roseivirga misakiensis]
MNKCVFLDRDGVLNEELGFQVTSFDQFKIKDGVAEGLKRLKSAGFILIVITNQSGIAKGHYTDEFVMKCHNAIQEISDNALDDIYFAPGYDTVSKTLSRKPNSLMFERAIAKHHIDIANSWMIGDRESDMIPAKKMKFTTIQVTSDEGSSQADFVVDDFTSAVGAVLS